MLSPDKPELMDNSVGDCLSVMLHADMLMGRDKPYGSRLKAEETVESEQIQTSKHKHTGSMSMSFTFRLSQLFLALVRRLVRRRSSSQRL